jgi:hypothetical protein
VLVVAFALAASLAAPRLALRVQSTSSPPQPGSSTADGTSRMAALLEKCAATADPERCLALGNERVALFRTRLASMVGKPGEAAAHAELARAILYGGDPEGALKEYDEAIAASRREHGGTEDSDFLDDVEFWRALAWLRLGELENCVGRHCCRSCIVPIDEGGLHVEKRGSQHAIESFTRVLDRRPDDDDARWLLNLAHMTLGTWPDGVPAKWLVHPSRFASDVDFPRWRDVAPECGLDVVTRAGGVVTEDLDGDGVVDVMFSAMGLRDPLRLFHGTGDGKFVERTHEAGLDGLVGGLNLIHADYDNDGDADVFVLRGAWLQEDGCIPNSLLRNRGDGTFEDVTETAGVLSFHPTQTGAFADFDGDGWLDLVVGNESSREGAQHPCELYLNRRDGTFTNVAKETGAAVIAFVKGVAVGDYDNDGRPDLYYSRRGEANTLLHNVPDATPGGPGFRFVDVTKAAGVQQPRVSFATWFFDYDNDGWLDLFVATNGGFGKMTRNSVGSFLVGSAGATEMPKLYHNEHNGRFRDVSAATHVDRAILTMGSNYGDLDNDGWLDFYLGNGAPDLTALLPNRMFRNDGGKRFQDVTSAGGFGHLQKGHGIAFADLDGDGDQDVVLEVGGFLAGDAYANVVFENPGNANHWITLRLKGVKANRCAIGARIEVHVATPSGERSMHVVAGTGGSFGSSTLQQEIGLGDAEKILYVGVRWPGSNTVQRVEGLPLDRVVAIEEGSPNFQVVPVKPFKLGGGAR